MVSNVLPLETISVVGRSGFIWSFIKRIFRSENYEVRVSATVIAREEKS